MEFTLEGRSGTTTVRFVHSGFLGDDWESEYDALAEGDPMYIHQLAQYVRFFRGRPVAIVEHFQPDITDREAAMAILRGAIGLGNAARWATRCGSSRPGSGAVEGSVDYVSSTIIGLRTDDALYRFAFIPMGGGIYLGHHLYRDDVDVAAVTSAWAAWLDRAVNAGQAASANVALGQGRSSSTSPIATTPDRNGRPSHGTQTSLRKSRPATGWPLTLARPSPASINTLTMSSVGTRGAGPMAKIGAASPDHSTSIRRPLAMTVSPTESPASGVPLNVATIGACSASVAAQPRGDNRPA